MKHSLPTLALGLTLAAPGLAQSLPPVNRTVTGANLIQNGDFELASDQSPPPGWKMWGAPPKDPKNFARDTAQKHGGAASYRVHHPAGTAAYTIADIKENSFRPQKGMAYEISFWAKADVAGDARFGIFSIIAPDPLVTGPQLESKTLALDTNWKQFRFRIEEGKDFSIDQANYLTLYFSATPYGQDDIEKTLWLDDIEVVEQQIEAPQKDEVGLSTLFGDGMVLQRQMPVPIWGVGKAGQTISVALNGQSAATTADAQGQWSLRLPAMEAGGPYEVRFQSGTPGAFSLKDVWVGDVWLASGQSNMDYPLKGWGPLESPARQQALQTAREANDAQLRFFKVAQNPVDAPQTVPQGAWRETTPENAGDFSAVAFYFARELRQKLGVPIGVIHASRGGSKIEGWMRREVLASEPTMNGSLQWWQRQLAAYPQAKTDYDEKLAAWQIEADKAKIEGKPAPAQPKEPVGPTYFSRPAALYNGMIAPLLPYAIKGAIWYQGESNGGNGAQYQTLFPALIKQWRADWKQGDFPFLWVQLANYRALQTQPVETGSWAELREAQAKTLSLPQTGMASAIDLADADDPGDIHPKNKEDVGKRLANVALRQVYGQEVGEVYGPMFGTMKTEGGKIRLNFAHADGLKSRGEKLLGFALAGADKQWVWADAVIDGNAIVVSSPALTAPIAVRYGWANNPVGNLVNGAGLPAIPFRTDSWE